MECEKYQRRGRESSREEGRVVERKAKAGRIERKGGKERLGQKEKGTGKT